MSTVILNYDEAIASEKALPPGPYEIKAYLEAPLSQMEMDQIQSDLINAGVQLIGMSQSNNTLSIKAIKPPPVEGVGFWPILIVAVLGVIFLGYTVSKTSSIIDSLAGLIIPMGIIVIGGLVLYNVTKKA